MSDNEYTIKDSGERMEYPSGMKRDLTEGKTDYLLIRDGVMYERWADHMTKGAGKYGKRNWLLANSDEEWLRFKESAARHFEQWLRGDDDEDHAAAVFFNINACETVDAELNEQEDEFQSFLDFLKDAQETDFEDLLTEGARVVVNEEYPDEEWHGKQGVINRAQNDDEGHLYIVADFDGESKFFERNEIDVILDYDGS